jgi:hypothetical protein
MFGLTKVFAALDALAENLQALAGTVAEANAGLRGRLMLDAPAEQPALEHEPEASGNGRRKRQPA